MKKQQKIWDKLYLSRVEWHFESKLSDNIKLEGKKVLELGVGTGKTLKSLIGKGAKEIVAIDNSKEAVKIVKNNIKDKNVRVIEGDILDIPLNDNGFDVVVCYYVLNNMLEGDRKRAIGEIKRVLADKGIILFEDFAVGDIRQSRKEGKEVEKNTVKRKDGLICHFFDEKEIKEMFKGYDLEVKTKEFKPFRALNEKRSIVSAVVKNKRF
jgi:ubiquinone/menaquinone biosynthesis C-methylase UbiE